MLLSALGADVRAASSTREAVEGAWTFHPHVLVCEVPARADRATALVGDLRREDLAMPAVAVAASAAAAFREAARGAGFAEVVAGPVTFSDLAAAIRQAVDSSRTQPPGYGDSSYRAAPLNPGPTPASRRCSARVG